MVSVVAAPAKEMMVAVVLNATNVVAPVAIVPLFIVVVPPFVEPRLMLEVDPAAPPVPMFTVLVFPEAVAFVV